MSAEMAVDPSDLKPVFSDNDPDADELVRGLYVLCALQILMFFFFLF
jgi:hypothetical protein